MFPWIFTKSPTLKCLHHILQMAVDTVLYLSAEHLHTFFHFLNTWLSVTVNRFLLYSTCPVSSDFMNHTLHTTWRHAKFWANGHFQNHLVHAKIVFFLSVKQCYWHKFYWLKNCEEINFLWQWVCLLVTKMSYFNVFLWRIFHAWNVLKLLKNYKKVKTLWV